MQRGFPLCVSGFESLGDSARFEVRIRGSRTAKEYRVGI